MNKLITLGCSFTDMPGWKEKLAETLNYDLVNLSALAGSNALQCFNFLEYILKNVINKKDIIIWQVTFSNRNGLRVHPDSILGEKVKMIQQSTFFPISTHFDDNNKNVFDDIPRYNLLHRSPMLKEKDILMNFDENDQLQFLLSILVLTRKFHDKLLVFFGDDRVLSKHNKQVFKNVLEKHNIPFLEESYVSWALRERLDFSDKFHPDQSAGILFSEKILHKKIEEFNWLSID